MKFALINGIKTEATKGAKAICRFCESELIAKCGEIKINHWAHKDLTKCDHWWESETEWHRTWKGYFHVEWQEVIHMDANGERHIADVKTDEKWVLEFQHSAIKPEERRSRKYILFQVSLDC
jgi:competence protein CoiA